MQQIPNTSMILNSNNILTIFSLKKKKTKTMLAVTAIVNNATRNWRENNVNSEE